MATRGTQPGRSDDAGRPYATRLSLDESSWVAPNAVLVGRVSLGPHAAVWYGCVLRGDLEPIEVGEATNVQDLSTLHVDEGCPVRIGRRVTIGHRAVIHGCVVEDQAVIGMGAVVLSGARVERGALVAAGAVVREGFTVPAGAIAAGVPARVIGKVGEKLGQRFGDGVDTYIASARAYREGRAGAGPYGGPRGVEP